MHGGAQERQRRAGTENVAATAGFARALELAWGEASSEAERQSRLRDRLVEGMTAIGGVVHAGHPFACLPNIASFMVDGVEGGDLVAALDLEGVEASTGSACTSGSTEPSHVLLAMGYPARRAAGSLRLSLGRETTEADVSRALQASRTVIDRLRSGSVTVATA